MVGPRHRPRHADAARPVLAGRVVGRHHPGVAVATLPTAWSRKTTPTFADALATLRLRIWEERISSMFPNLRDNRKSHDPTVAQLAGILARAA